MSSSSEDGQRTARPQQPAAGAQEGHVPQPVATAEQPVDRRQRGIRRRALVQEELGHQDGVVTVAQLRELGLTYDEIRAEVEAGRWHRVGRKTLSITGPEPRGPRALARRAVWEVGGHASLDGASALIQAGLTGWSEDKVHVSVVRGARYRLVEGVRVHILRERGRVIGSDPPRTPPEVAALRAATWARTDREAATILAIGVQQRIVAADRLGPAWESSPRSSRRALLGRLVGLVADGAQALSEIDFAELGRARGWPEPDRQVVVRTSRGRIYLDVRFTRYGTVAEINGVQHYSKLVSIDDALRRNEHAISGERALEIPAVGLLLDPEPLLDQVEAALRAGGWPGPDLSCGSGPAEVAS